MLGKKHSEETKMKMRQRQMGKNNSFYGKTHTKEHREKLSRLQKERARNWDEIGYNQRHRRMIRKIPKSNQCSICGDREHRLSLMNLNHEYNNSIKEWKWACQSCHEKHDLKKGIRRKYVNPNRNSLGQFIRGGGGKDVMV